MSIIKTLPPHVANLIAAGEVVERPASIIKELMENAVDAGADNISVEIKNGGIEQITIIDNGCGMSREDAETCFIRHATSKIRTEDDLHAILTLGFRGEALAAISAVSKIDLTTRRAEDMVGTHVICEAGTVIAVEDCGCPIGTTITVREVFYNTPARMKFLKKNTTEANYCAAAVDHIALSHPEIAVRFIKDSRVSMRTPGDGQLLPAILGVCGRDFTDSLIPIPMIGDAGALNAQLQVWGYVTKPERALSGRGSQYFILNGRHIRSKTLTAALEEAYRSSIMVGKYPGCVLCAAIDPEHVDVNVHPAKLEVKFSDERAAFRAVYEAVKHAFAASERPQFTSAPRTESAPKPESKPEPITTPAPVSKPVPTVIEVKPVERTVEIREKILPDTGLLRNTSISDFYNTSRSEKETDISISAQDFELPLPEPVEPIRMEELIPPAPPEPDTPADEPHDVMLPDYRILGEAFHSYVIVELDDALMYIDKHAAHERILYNKLKSETVPPPGQILLTPISLPIARADREQLDENEQELARLGLEYTDFGDGNILVHTIPPHIDAEDTADFIREVCQRMKKNENDDRREDILHSIACKAAIKAGWITHPQEIDALVRQVLADPDLRYCPHGRPVALTLSRRDFEKEFFRT